MTADAREVIARALHELCPDDRCKWMAATRADTVLHALSEVGIDLVQWQPIETAPKDGTVFDAWLGDCDESDRQFYCTEGTRRSSGWRWHQGKFRPMGGLPALTTFVQPTHWMPLPEFRAVASSPDAPAPAPAAPPSAGAGTDSEVEG